MTLYITFSIYTATQLELDEDAGIIVNSDAADIASKHGLEISIVHEKQRAQIDERMRRQQAVGNLFMPGLFLGVVGYVSLTSFRQWRIRYPGTE
jgi:hypothetical protein